MGEGEREMVPPEVRNSTQICYAAKVLFCLSSGEVFILSWRKTHVHTHIHTSLTHTNHVLKLKVVINTSMSCCAVLSSV